MTSDQESQLFHDLYLAVISNATVNELTELIKQGADPSISLNVLNLKKPSLLVGAIVNDTLTSAKFELLATNHVNIQRRDGQDISPFEAAVYMADYEVVTWLLNIDPTLNYIGIGETFLEADGIDDYAQANKYCHIQSEVYMHCWKLNLDVKTVQTLERDTSLFQSFQSGILHSSEDIESILASLLTNTLSKRL